MRLAHLTGVLILFSFVIASCQSEPPTPSPTYTPYPTYTAYPTYTPAVSSRDLLPSEKAEELIWPTGPRDDVIPVEDAAQFIGTKITVEGVVMRTHNSGSAVFLNFSTEAGAKDFTSVIFSDDWPKFPAPPENLFDGKLVRIEGVIQEYQDAPEIIIKSPHQIEVAVTLGQSIATSCDCQSAQAFEPPTAVPTLAASEPPTVTASPVPPELPVATTTPEGVAVISWADASAYDGQVVTVEGQIVDSYNSGKTVFLNFAKDYRHTFKVVIFADAWPLFPAPPEDYYKNKTVRVTGQIELYQNAPEIIADRPDQIEIVE